MRSPRRREIGHHGLVLPGPGVPPSVVVRLNAQDIATFSAWQRKRTRSAQGSGLALLGGAGLGVMEIVVLATNLVLGIVCTAAVVLALVAVVRRSRRLRLEYFARRAALASGTLTASEEGLRLESTYASTEYRWRAFSQVVDSDDHFFLLIGDCPECAILIPKRCFESPAQADAFSGVAQKCLRGAATP